MRILPIKSKFITLFKLFSIILIAFSFISVNIPQVVEAVSLEEELEQIKKELEKIRISKKNLEQDISKEKSLQNTYEQELVNLKNKIDILSNKIDEKRLVIKELQLEIDILTNKLEETESEIITAETELLDLEGETNTRLIDMYLSQKTFSELNMIVTPKGQSDVIKYNLYHNTIQDTTNSLVASLKDKRVILEGKKVTLEEDKIKVLRDEVQLNEELLALERDEADLNSTKSIYSSKRQQSIAKVESNSNTITQLTEEEKELDVKYNQIIAQILARGELANGFPVKAGDFLGYEGWTGYVIPSSINGRHLHFMVYSGGSFQNPCSYLPAGAYPGCGGNGIMSVPIAPKGQITSGFRTPGRPTHNAIDIAAGGGAVIAAHSGFVYFGYEACPSWATCNNGPAIWAKVCEVNGCGTGLRTLYYHLACTSEPTGSARSCKN